LVLLVGAVPMLATGAQQASVPGVGSAARVPQPDARALQPGDKVKVTIWREPDLSGEFEVQPDGGVTFPKIGRIQVDRISTDSLRAVIVARYAVSLRDPTIEVTPLRRIVVSGSVRDAGFHYADPTVSVLGAVALAGGVTEDGDRGKVELLRDGRDIPINVSDTSSLGDSALQSGDQVLVPERSWAARNTGLLASMLTAAALVVAAIIKP
jgi:polysaccharide biosynthesis/export protein